MHSFFPHLPGTLFSGKGKHSSRIEAKKENKNSWPETELPAPEKQTENKPLQISSQPITWQHLCVLRYIGRIKIRQASDGEQRWSDFERGMVLGTREAGLSTGIFPHWVP